MRKPIAEWWRAAAAVCRRARLRDRQERARPAGNPYIRLSIPPVVRYKGGFPTRLIPALDRVRVKVRVHVRVRVRVNPYIPSSSSL